VVFLNIEHIYYYMKILIDNKIKCGVYKIQNLVNNKCYIGSTTGVLKYRCITHRCHLRHNRHSNQHLQNSWNKYGEDNFEFSVLEMCDIDRCVNREQYYIDTLNPEYNINKFANSTFGYKHTKEAKEKISNAFSGENHPAYSGKYVFYHPTYGYIIEDQKTLCNKFNLIYTSVNKMCRNELNKHKNWIFLEKFNKKFKHLNNINEIYKTKINSNRPLFAFYHKQHGKFIIPINVFCHKFNFKNKEIGGIYNGTRYSANGWICFGKCDSKFSFPKNLNEIYKNRLEKSNRNQRKNIKIN